VDIGALAVRILNLTRFHTGCGETCPDLSLCQQCGSEEIKGRVVDYIMLSEFGEHDCDLDPIVFLSCGHFLASSNLDGKIGLENFYKVDSNGEFYDVCLPDEVYMELPSCFECRSPIVDVNRYSRMTKLAIVNKLGMKMVLSMIRQADMYAKRLADEEYQVVPTIKVSGKQRIEKSVASSNSHLDRLARDLERNLEQCCQTPESKVYESVMSRIQRQLLSQRVELDDVGVIGREMISDRMHPSTSNEASTRFRVLIARVNWLKGILDFNRLARNLEDFIRRFKNSLDPKFQIVVMNVLLAISDLLSNSYAQIESAMNTFQASGKTICVEECCLLFLEILSLEVQFIVRNRKVLVEYKLFAGEKQVVEKLETLKQAAHEHEDVVFVQESSRARRAELLSSIDKVVGGIVTFEELSMVMKAMKTGSNNMPASGQLYHCTCGYLYFVGKFI
jgi:hypothetical protein